MFRTVRLSIVALVLAVAAAGVSAASAGAATTRTDSITGTEVAYTSTQGSFTGYARGDLPGTWAATIDHTVLSPNATITGGTFTLYTVIGWSAKTVEGTFAYGGTVTKTYQASGCGIQRYAVKDKLVNVGVNGGSGTGYVSATLTHHRVSVLGHCIAYSATIGGSVTLTF
jgi:hypothetical protein